MYICKLFHERKTIQYEKSSTLALCNFIYL